MPITYIPLNIFEYCKKNNIPIPENKKLNKNIYNTLSNLYENTFCIFELIRGKNKYSLCGNRIKDDNKYCKRHRKVENVKEQIEKEIYYCNGKSRRREKCGRLVKNNGDLCFAHKNGLPIKNNIKNNSLVVLKKEILFTSRKNKNIDFKYFKKINCIEIIKLLNINYKIEGETYRIKENNYNIVITNNKYYDNNNNCGGKGILDLYLYITKKDIENFLKFIEKTNIFIFPTSENELKNSKTNKIIKNENSLVVSKKEIPKENKNNIINIKKYLIEERKLNKEMIEYLIIKGSISADNNNNCIFYDNNKQFLHLRGTTKKRFFCSIGESNFIQYKNNENPLYFFESPIDALSYITLNVDIKGNVISTNGEMLINKVDKLMNKNVNEVFLCFDNDKKGDELSEKVKTILHNYNINIYRLKPRNKDWNEDLCMTNKN